MPANRSQDSQEPSQSLTGGAGPSTAANEAMDGNRWVPNTGLQASPGDAAEVAEVPAAEESPNQEAEAEEIPAANTQPMASLRLHPFIAHNPAPAYMLGVLAV
ncbi:hypothetical protein HaLaN_32587 [Haematococcus lacustris]|uniref:Uncharacterized protein n=1 Tax=Haematococcus lacustris TaxID=44745 RepID=A0A6A0AK89_HAELA|nr:hypothetical protein HaLaN_32587 [Haematococcus lacustris]